MLEHPQKQGSEGALLPVYFKGDSARHSQTLGRIWVRQFEELPTELIAEGYGGEEGTIEIPVYL